MLMLAGNGYGLYPDIRGYIRIRTDMATFFNRTDIDPTDIFG